jgi:quercetin dioxygenase-like cupin family protein
MLEIVAPDRAKAVSRGNDGMTGTAVVQDIGAAIGTEDLRVLTVFFDEGVRSRPHVHPDHDQILYYIEGDGVCAVDGGPDELVPEGSFVRLPKGVPHMHGAAAGNTALHLSFLVAVEITFDIESPDAWREFVSVSRRQPRPPGAAS